MQSAGQRTRALPQAAPGSKIGRPTSRWHFVVTLCRLTELRNTQKPRCTVHLYVCLSACIQAFGSRQEHVRSPFLPEEPSPLTLRRLPLSTPGGTFREIFFVRRTRPSPPQVLQGVARSPDPSQSGQVDIYKPRTDIQDNRIGHATENSKLSTKSWNANNIENIIGDNDAGNMNMLEPVTDIMHLDTNRTAMRAHKISISVSLGNKVCSELT